MARHSTGFQTTVRDRVTLDGIGVHSGKPVSMSILPADADTGVVFLRTNLPGSRDVEIPANVRSVSATELCTVLGDMSGAFVATVEHLVAGLSGLGIDNVLIEIDGAEVPIMDGSAHDFVDAIDQVGIATLRTPRRYIKILKPIRVESGAAFGELRPYDGLRMEVEIDYPSALIGRQRFAADMTPAVFRRDVARARTFGFLSDVERLWAAGYALGSSLENSVVLAEDRIVNPEGLRWTDEFVRHKVLDAIGDLALAGAPILGCYRSYRGGHKLNSAMVAALFADPEAWTYETATITRESGHADLSAGVPVPAFGPDVS
ncbi:MAG TPA: UDP-3-O-acyl-N-acetylglucosamine deacetylase [Hyphomicrobiales bacterium]|nr:UDP-3-O-acyl-N-acetylglucosamine deacetylase [Hyphomicrobiales bacterium]